MIIAIPSLPPAASSALIRAAADTGAHVRYLPSFLSALERAARAADMRTVSLADLLGRAERRILEPSVQAMLRGARVLVTGAGGKPGAALQADLALARAAAELRDGSPGLFLVELVLVIITAAAIGSIVVLLVR